MKGIKRKYKKVKKYQHHTIVAFIVAILTILATISLIITNFFLPVKYLFAYMVIGSNPPAGKLQITFFDLDDGESTLLTFPDGKVALIDGGNGRYASEQKLLRTLNSLKIDRIDYIFSTTVRENRCGGLAEIVKYKGVGKIFLPYVTSDEFPAFTTLLNEVEKRGVEIAYNAFGEGIVTDEYLFAILSPNANIYSNESPYFDLNKDGSSANINRASAIYFLEYDRVRVILLGDSPESEQNRILSQYDTDAANFKVLGRQIVLDSFNIAKLSYQGRTTNFSSRLMTRSVYRTAILTGEEVTVKTLSSLLGTNKEILSTKSLGDIKITISDGEYIIE